MTTTNPAEATQLYQVFIKASPERIWSAITRPEETSRYFHGSVAGKGWMFVLSGLKTLVETGSSMKQG